MLNSSVSLISALLAFGPSTTTNLDPTPSIGQRTEARKSLISNLYILPEPKGQRDYAKTQRKI